MTGLICHGNEPASSAPSVYKDIWAVARAQRELVKIERVLRPVLNYKGGLMIAPGRELSSPEREHFASSDANVWRRLITSAQCAPLSFPSESR